MPPYFGESSPETITTFMQQIILEYHDLGRSRRRSEPRELVAIPVTVHLLDDEMEPTGESFEAVTRDISYGGIGLFHAQPIEIHRFLKIKLVSPENEATAMTILARVEHTTKCGGFFIIGCRFAVCLESDQNDDDLAIGDEDEVTTDSTEFQPTDVEFDDTPQFSDMPASDLPASDLPAHELCEPAYENEHYSPLDNRSDDIGFLGTVDGR